MSANPQSLDSQIMRYPTWDTTRTGRSVDGTDIVGAWLGGNVWANSVGSSVVGVCVHG